MTKDVPRKEEIQKTRPPHQKSTKQKKPTQKQNTQNQNTPTHIQDISKP